MASNPFNFPSKRVMLGRAAMMVPGLFLGLYLGFMAGCP